MTENQDQQTKIETVNDEDETEVYSLKEVIEENDVASAVLAASDPTNCSYNEGYVYRQALYCCITCLKEKLKSDETSQVNSDDNAYLNTDETYLHAICLACTYECHQNHELIELYTKRNFKCDCGNSKFSSSSVCKLQPNKDIVNTLNKYNHNFKGLYCTCNRPYPEICETEVNNTANEDSSEEMIQCSICEDWFHINHLLGNEKFPNNEEEFEDVICHMCMEKNKYLWYNLGYIAVKIEKTENESTLVDVEETTPTTNTEKEEICVLKRNQSKFKDVEQTNQACCFLNGWRAALCKCNDCLELYKRNQVEFLLNPTDTIKYYEDKGKQNEETRHIDENKLLDDHIAKMNRVSQIELLHSVKDFKEDLTNFLTSFAQNGQVVKRENVVQFFEELNERKKRKLESNPSISSYYCK